MNQKVLVAMAIIALILGILNLILLLGPTFQVGILPSQSTIPNNSEKIQLEVANPAIQNVSDYYVIQVTVFLPDEMQTLFNCYVQVDYLTENNVWKTTTENIGIVNYQDHLQIQLHLDNDFKSSNPYLEVDGYFHGDEEPNVEVNSYGYLKP